eukprot:TRINITY_DN3698_c0_g1_i10.p1 TRINITY_DN3698_c0_g1~~TRINITY_DN3698_c0_g1_i10.p1  ORF type:complete len:690 (+),score=56.21 TRINITY_DN3698_c0_g1_i10:230-2071(+)
MMGDDFTDNAVQILSETLLQKKAQSSEPIDQMQIDAGARLADQVLRKKCCRRRPKRSNMTQLIIWDLENFDCEQMMNCGNEDQLTDANNPLWRLAVCAALAYEQECSEEGKMQNQSNDQSNDDAQTHNKRRRTRKSENTESQEENSDKTVSHKNHRQNGNKKRKVEGQQKTFKQQISPRGTKAGNSDKDCSTSPQSTTSTGIYVGDYNNIISQYQKLLQSNLDFSKLVSPQQILELSPLMNFSTHQMLEWTKMLQGLNGFGQTPMVPQSIQQQYQQSLQYLQLQQQQQLQEQQRCASQVDMSRGNSDCKKMNTFQVVNQVSQQFPKGITHSSIHVYIAKKIQQSSQQGKQNKSMRQPKSFMAVSASPPLQTNLLPLQTNLLNASLPLQTNLLNQPSQQLNNDFNKLMQPSLCTFPSSTNSSRTFDYAHSNASEVSPAINSIGLIPNIPVMSQAHVPNVFPPNVLQSSGIAGVLSSAAPAMLCPNGVFTPTPTLNMLKSICNAPQYQSILQTALQQQQSSGLLSGLQGQQMVQQKQQMFQMYGELGRMFGSDVMNNLQNVPDGALWQMQQCLGTQNVKGGLMDQDAQIAVMMHSMRHNQGIGTHLGLQAARLQK